MWVKAKIKEGRFIRICPSSSSLLLGFNSRRPGADISLQHGEHKAAVM